MFKRILVLQKGPARAEQGLVIAERIARASGGTIILLPEVPASTAPGTNPRPSMLWQESTNAADTDTTLSLPRAAQSQAPPGTATSDTLVSGPDALPIFNMAHVQENDLILIVNPGAAEFKQWMPGSAERRAIQNHHVPVLVLRDEGTMLSLASPETAHPLHPLTAVVALDGSQQAEAAISPAAKLVAALMAPAKGAMHLTRVVLRPSVDAILHGRAWMDARQRDQAMGEATDYLCQITDALHGSLEGELALSITWSVAVDSNITNALIGVAERGDVVSGTCVFYGCDLLALAIHE